MSDTIHRYLNEHQVSSMTGLSLGSLRNWRWLGKGPVYVKIGRSVRYKESDILEFMEAHMVSPNKGA
jgi:predicted DNA-binding transcriptional regulator AlpA